MLVFQKIWWALFSCNTRLKRYILYIYIYIYISTYKYICIKKCVFNNFEKYRTLLLPRLWRKYIYLYIYICDNILQLIHHHHKGNVTWIVIEEYPQLQMTFRIVKPSNIWDHLLITSSFKNEQEQLIFR